MKSVGPVRTETATDEYTWIIAPSVAVNYLIPFALSITGNTWQIETGKTLIRSNSLFHDTDDRVANIFLHLFTIELIGSFDDRVSRSTILNA